jgi:beta-lactam-binding protein with PASTA domain/tRNA A-37 threonylcarbamoyl transferase component Bud32
MSSPEVFSSRYELVRHIARGGMAQVYLAQDLLLDRPVAIKVLFPELSSDPSFVERFRREAQAAANLSHPNIISIYDWGQGEHTYFIVMEYIDGQTLSSLVRRGPLPPVRAAAIGAEIAEALDFAHRRGVIHRDVKPGNVLIDQTGRVKVGDFGIARAVSNASEGLTQTGAVMGTATYFSPEQAQGKAVDARSDVYSLGVVLYEMVTGRPPFSGDSPVAIAYKHVREHPLPPSQVNPSVPADFEAIVMAAMAKDPYERYQSAADLRDDLTRFQAGQPVAAAQGLRPGETRAVAGPPPYYSGRESSHLGAGGGDDEIDPTYVASYGGMGDETTRRSRSAWWASLFAVLLAVLGVLVFFIGRNAGWWDETSPSKVPDVHGLPVAEAKAKLASAGFRNPAVHPETSKLVQKGFVIGTSPAAGSAASGNDTITLDVSAGPPLVAVPNLTKKNCSSADTLLTSLGLRDKPTQQNSNTIAQGLVISTDPPAGQRVAWHDTVVVYCSAGLKTTIVPNLQGLTPAQAGYKLSAAHLKPAANSVSKASPTVRKGLVIYTSPPAGTSEQWGTTVTLYVSSGQPQSTIPRNLIGEGEVQAQNQLKALNLISAIVPQATTNPAKNGIVIATHPLPGTPVTQGSTVTLRVGLYTPPAATTTSPAATTTSPAATTTSPAATTTAPAATTTTAPAATTTSPAATTTAPAATTSVPIGPPGQAGPPGHGRGNGNQNG